VGREGRKGKGGKGWEEKGGKRKEGGREWRITRSQAVARIADRTASQ